MSDRLVDVAPASLCGQGITRFSGCKVLRDHTLVEEDVWICEGRIIDPQSRFFTAASHHEYAADRVIDCRGLILSPGFIDIQINGAFGVDFSSPEDCTPANVDMVAQKLCQHGVTSFLPTMITSSPEVYQQILPSMGPRTGNCQLGASILGVHVEGPFISSHKYGAHPREKIQEPTEGLSSLERIYGSLDHIKLITIAPELPGSLSAIQEFSHLPVVSPTHTAQSSSSAQDSKETQEVTRRQYYEEREKRWLQKKVVSVGHSEAAFDVAVQAVEAGATLITHLFNAMIPFHHRDPGLIGLLGSDIRDRVFYSLIVDGIHSHPASVNIAYSAHPHGVILVTDAMQAMGLPPGHYHLGGMKIEVTSQQATIAGTTTLAGSIATLDSCVRNFKKFTGCSLSHALRAASTHPAMLLGLYPQKGSLRYDSDADLVLLDESCQVVATIVNGCLAFSRSDRPLKMIASPEPTHASLEYHLNV